MVNQDRQILGPLAQRRDAQCHGVDAVQEVVTKAALVHEFLDVLVRGSDNTDVGLKCARAADGAVLATIQEAQQTHLHRTRHLAELIQKERAFFCGGDESGLCSSRTGKRTFFVAEEFALQQFPAHRSAVYGQKRSAGPPAEVMEQSRGDFFARAGFSLNEDRRVGGCDLGDLGLELLPGPAGSFDNDIAREAS